MRELDNLLESISQTALTPIPSQPPVHVEDLRERLQTFEPVDLEAEPASIQTDFSDQFLKVFTRMAKAQWKTQQKADLSARKVAEHLDEHGELLNNLKQQRAKLEDQVDQLQRFILEVCDLITGFKASAEASGDSEMQSSAATMMRALQKSMDKVGLREIPAIGEVPDPMYHFVLSTRQPESRSEYDRIVEVVGPGYTMYGEVVRKAKVIVAK